MKEKKNPGAVKAVGVFVEFVDGLGVWLCVVEYLGARSKIAYRAYLNSYLDSLRAGVRGKRKRYRVVCYR